MAKGARPGPAGRLGAKGTGSPSRESGRSSTGGPTGLLSALLDSLVVMAADRVELESHVRGYCGWIKADEEGTRTLAALRAECESLTGGARTYRHVAVLGFSADIAPNDDPQYLSALIDGVDWLAGRKWFASGRVPGFEADPIALLGVALGVGRIASATDSEIAARGAQLRQWIADLLRQSRAITAEPWELGLIGAATYVVSESADAIESVCRNAPVIAAALAARGMFSVAPDDERVALGTILDLPDRRLDPERATTQLVALRWLYRTLPTALSGRVTREDVVALLRGVGRSLRRWRWEEKPRTRGAGLVRWEINNEYHVQDLLWIVLAPTFPDLEDEENLPSLGQKHPRYDLGVPSLKLIVEVKFVRRGENHAFGKVIEEVAADASLYLRDHARYIGIVVVVWDDSRSTEQHAELEQGLLGIPGVVGAVVLTRPGRMESKIREP